MLHCCQWWNNLVHVHVKICKRYNYMSCIMCTHTGLFHFIVRQIHNAKCIIMRIALYSIQWNLFITRSLGPRKPPRYTRPPITPGQKKQRNLKSRDQQNHLATRGSCYIRPRHNEALLHFVSYVFWLDKYLYLLKNISPTETCSSWQLDSQIISPLLKNTTLCLNLKMHVNCKFKNACKSNLKIP